MRPFTSKTIKCLAQYRYLGECFLVERQKVKCELGGGGVFDHVEPVAPHLSAVQHNVAPALAEEPSEKC